MKTTGLALLSVALFALGCGGGSDGQSHTDATDQAVPASATPDSPDPALVNSPEANSNMYEATPTGVVTLLKQGDTLFFAGSSGLTAVTPAGSVVLKDEPISAAIQFAGHLWLASEGALATSDGLVTIVPEFATSFTALEVFDDELYVGTDGNGVWKLVEGKLVPSSEDWHVKDLAATNFGLFAVTELGLFSYQDDRWHARRLDDTSLVLDDPTVTYFRYPYLYVGTQSKVLRYDGGSWQQYDLNASVSALGWQDAKLYIGTLDGSLFTLDGGMVQAVPAPDGGAITSILRFDGRLHVAGEKGVFRLRHGRFEKIDGEKPAESEPKHEPIAFLL